ncbi:NAD(P)H-dependent oxidoreductase [Chitinophaga pinensis]|uniref:NAD(P)H-dependent oxidoreductase n=1 Tax=Chitinophaga pinensis TaxID=79329 RepID=UPI001C99591E|nr:NAD(P)H-dependent oxidoreductase [Chitinophaga pinensis]
MKILIVLAHPELKSMNGAMFETAIAALTTAGHEVKVSDLYRDAFNPVSDRNNFTTPMILSSLNNNWRRCMLRKLPVLLWILKQSSKKWNGVI